MDESRLGLLVEHADGSTKRLGYDEQDGGDIPGNLGFTTTPSGFGTLNYDLLREIEPRADESLYDGVTLTGPGRQVAYEGRMEQFPRQGGRSASVSVGAVGWSSHLTDDATFREVYADRDPGSWGGPTLARQSVIGLSPGLFDKDYTASAGNGGLSFSGQAGTAIPIRSEAEVIYSAPAGCKIAYLCYIGTESNTTNVEAATAFSSPTGTSGFSTVALTLNGALQVATLTAERYVMLRAFASAGHTPAAGLLRLYTTIAAYGNHGVPLQSVFGEPYHVLASDVIADVVGRAAPLLNFTTGEGGSIQPTSFPIPHLVFASPTTAADVIATANGYHGWNAGVWENRTFKFAPKDQGIEWEARVADGAVLSLEGDNAGQLINGIVVAYTADGISKLAGPIGSGCDVESADLGDTSSTNPVNAHGIPRKWPVISLSYPTTDAGAVQVGTVALFDANNAGRKGQITLTGSVRHPTEGLVPTWRVRAGDRIRISDKPSDITRSIVGTSYSHPSRQITIDCDQTSNLADQLQQRFALVGGVATF